MLMLVYFLLNILNISCPVPIEWMSDYEYEYESSLFVTTIL